ncbi:MAG: alpha/beta hydrolase [Rickettsiales bacterium]|nr:alpha/beta hydrolase [Rickettsiales bacterium]
MMKWVVLTVALLVSACAPQTQLASPEKAEHLPVRSWVPKAKPRAIILAVHGFNDYSLAFDDAGNYFQSKGIAMFSYDQRGFGETDARGLWAGSDNLTQDLRYQFERLSKRYPKTPIYVLGESMGGAVTISAFSHLPVKKIRGVILVAPALWSREQMPWIYTGSLWLAAHTLPFRELTGSDLKIQATDNIPLLQRMVADPLVIKSTRIDAIYGVVNMMDQGYDAIPQVSKPVLLLYGAKDQVIPKSSIMSARERFTAPLTYIYYPNGYHMLLRDLQREQVFADIVRWIEQTNKQKKR